MVDYQNAPSITRHSSDTMEGTTERPLAAIDIPNKIDAEKAAAVDDKESNRDSEEKETEEEKEGSLKDYFVSQRSGRI